MAIGACAALAGCGGSSHAATKKEVIARGDQICQTADSQVRAVPPPAAGSPSSLASYYRNVTPIVRTEVQQLLALPRPAKDRTLLTRYLAAISLAAGQYQALAAAAARGDSAAVAGTGAALRANPAGDLAGRYGLTGCGGSLGTSAS